MIQLIKGECLEAMKQIPTGSIDAIITDPPYGTTACKWDSVIDFDLMWEQLNRIIKPNGAIVLFGSEPFSSALRMSNIKNYKYDWIWNKVKSGNMFTVKYQPSKIHEIISVFNNHNYYPIKEPKSKETIKRLKRKCTIKKIKSDLYGETKNTIDYTGFCYPRSIQIFNKEANNQYKKPVVHPTQKPVALMEYLIKTYTNENETVLDFTMGSGSTGVAAKNLNRNFIGIEQDQKYFNIAKNRINELRPNR